MTRFLLTLACAAAVAATFETLPKAAPSAAGAPVSLEAIRLRRGPLDVTSAKAALMTERATQNVGAMQDLFLVRLAGANGDGVRRTVEAAGLEILAPIPANALLVRGSGSALARLLGQTSVAWCGRFGPEERLDPRLDKALAERERNVPVAVELVDDEPGEALAANILRGASTVPIPPARVGRFLVVRAALSSEIVESLLERPEVVNVEAWSSPTMQDERAGVITAGMLDATGTQPAGPGYLEWLASLGLMDHTADFGIDFADSGLDLGVPSDPGMHPDFRDRNGVSRISYATSFVSGPRQDAADFYGHGTLNASIATGYDAGTGAPYVDERGFHFGLGVAPFAHVGGSKIFDRGDSINLAVTYADIAAHAYRNGMRVSSNSWGAPANGYTIDSQQYDTIVRDADPDAPGNQQLTVLFAAGNASGGGKVLTPATGKNVIAVGASENYRPEGIVDGCGVGDEGADNVDDVVDFSSGGPLNDGRSKPDLVAPGSHVQGCASQNPFYNGKGLCVDADFTRYFPYGQTLYAWASGTSQATPVVAGAAAFVRALTVLRGLLPDSVPPSPAMVKAMLLASTTPMLGERAGRTLPDPRQGYGRVNLGPVADDAARVLVDESVRFHDAGESYSVEGDVGDPERPFRVALVWTDAPALPVAAPQVNDLDLEVRVGDTLYRGNAYSGFVSTPNPEGPADTLNTCETVTIPPGTRGHFVVTVRAATVAGDGVPGDADVTDQDFALVVYNVDDGRWTPPEPPVVTSVKPKTAQVGYKLVISGELLTATSSVEINGLAVPADRIRFVERKGQLRLKGTAAALRLVAGTNSLVVVDGQARSAEFDFQFSP